jgi:eukaryotic-like serine/threonine-protein kinase
MVRRNEPEATDRDEKLGEAIEAYLALIESGTAPDAEAFADRYPESRADLLAALEGLALVQGLVGEPGGSAHGHGPEGRLESGRRIAGYKIVRELGRGGMGVVYEAVHMGLDRPVALKVLGIHAAPDGTGRRRFLNEARTAAGLHHTHIVPVFDVGQVGGLCYYAMQRIEGSGLDRVVRHLRRDRATAAGSGSGPGMLTPLSLWGRVGGVVTPFSKWGRSNGLGQGRGAADPARDTGPWPVAATVPASLSSSAAAALSGAALSAEGLSRLEASAAASPAGLDRERERDHDDEAPPFEPPRGSAYYRWVADVGRQAADALGHAHRRGVIHRDIKPSNLLVDGRGLVWVADFGLARRLADPGQSHHESFIGTPRYMSPEQARVGPVDGRTDLYSLGATLYELLALRPPFEGRSAAELVEQIGHLDPPPSPRQFDRRIPRDLEMIVLKLLSKQPADRYATAGDLADDLRRFLNLEPVRARRISPLGRLWRLARRRPGMTAVTTAAVVTVLAVSTYAHVNALWLLDQTRAAWRKELWSEATLVRMSNMPNRRVTGLGLIKKSAALKPESDLRAKLRSEALEFLVLRDVEARRGVATGPVRGIAYGPDGAHLAALTFGENGEESFDLWDVARNQRLESKLLRGARPAGGGPTPVAPAAAVPAAGGEAAEKPPPPGSSSPTNPGPAAPSSPLPPRGGGGGGGGGPRGRGGFGPAIALAGQCLAVLSPDGHGVHLFDALTGAKIDELRMPGHPIVGLYATPDGQRLVTVEDLFMARWGEGRPGRGQAPGGPNPGRAAGPVERYRVNLWDPGKTAGPLASLATVDNETTGWTMPPLVAVSPDSRNIATALFRKTAVTLWSAQTGKPLPGSPIETALELTAVALGPDDQLAAAGNGEIRLWDIELRSPMPSLATTQGFVRMLRFSPRGSLLAVVGGTGREIELWDTADTAVHSLIAVLPTTEPVFDLAFAPDGRTLAAAGPSPTTSVWTVVEGEVRTRLGGFDAVTRSMAFRPDGLLALGSFKGTIRFWNAGRCVSSGPGPDAAAVVTGEETPATATTPAQPKPATGSSDDAPARDRPVTLTFDDLGRLVTLERDALRVCKSPPQCSDSTFVPLPSGPDRPGPMDWNWTRLAASSDGHTLAVSRGAQIFLWHSGAPETLVRLQLPTDLTATLNRDRGGERDRDRPRGAARGRPGFGPPPLVWRALAVASRSDRLYVVDGSGNVLAWAIDGARSTSLSWSGLVGKAMSLALSPDGALLAVGGSDGTVTLIETAQGTVRARLLPEPDGSDGRIWALAFAPGGRELAVGNQQGQVELWSLADPSAPMLRLPGHRGSVAALAFDTQGRHLATAGSDKTVDVWNLELLRDEFGRLGLTW